MSLCSHSFCFNISFYSTCRSDGSLRIGEITKSQGLPWQNVWEVCVEADGQNSGSCRTELGVTLARPTPAGLAKLGIGAGQGAGASPVVGTGRVGQAPPPPKPAATQAQAPADPVKVFSTQRVGVSLPFP
jgi:hypothetical protein